MKKIIFLIILILTGCGFVFAELSPEYMLNRINNSEIKTAAKIKSVKTIQSKKGYKIQLVKFEGLYENEGKIFEAKCHNYTEEPPVASSIGEPRRYIPQKNSKVFVTIDKNGGEITSMVNMDESFEKRLQKSPKKIRYDCNGAYFEE